MERWSRTLLTLIYITIGLLGIVLTISLFNALTAPVLKNASKCRNSPRVSVLIPARNEEENISACIDGFLAQNYDNYEIRILDDQSTDRTRTIIEKYSKIYPEVHTIYGDPLPSGWLGKNWACHQLSHQVDAEILIFTDADIRPGPDLVANTVAYMQKYQLGLLSTFTEKVTVTFAEKLVVPVVDMFVYASLPLWLTYISRVPSLSAACGQWIAFTRDAYDKINGHQAVSTQIVEDVELSRLAKRYGIRMLTTVGTGTVSCRMYHTFSGVWHGFSKNLFGLVSYKTVPFLVLTLMIFMTCVFPYITAWFRPYTLISVIAISMNIVIRVVMAIKYKHPFIASVVLHPIGIMLTLLIGMNSFYQTKKGGLQWKGRDITIQENG